MGLNSLAGESPGRGERVIDLAERTWLPRHCRGDQSAFPALLDAYRRPVYAYLVRCGLSAPDRDDVFQGVFLKIHAAAASYEPARPLGPWIFTIVANSVRNHLRDRQVQDGWLSADQTGEPPDPHPGPERSVDSQRTVSWLEGAIAALPLRQREALMLTAVAGLTQQEAAEALSTPINTVKTHLRRARLALVKDLARRDGEHR